MQLSKKSMQEKKTKKQSFKCKAKISSLGITVQHHSLSLVMPNSYPHDITFNPHLTAIEDSSILTFAHAVTVLISDCFTLPSLNGTAVNVAVAVK